MNVFGASFRGLGVLPGGSYSSSMPNDISFDGSVIVGESQSSRGTQAFRWTLSTGMVGLGDLGGKDPYSSASGISGDGRVIVGNSRSTDSGTRAEGFRWSGASGMVGMGVLPGGALFSSVAFGVSADGSVVSGSSTSTLSPILGEAYRWTAATGMVGLGVLPGSEHPATIPHQLSADGSAIVGWAFTGNGQEAFRWSAGDGLVAMGGLTGVPFRSQAYGVSADGSVIAGFSSGPGPVAFRWTEAEGMQNLGYTTGGIFSEAFAVSADGSTIVGVSDVDSTETPFVWDGVHGMRNLVDVLVELGLGPALQDWYLYEATAVSADGLTIAGWGYRPDGSIEAWVANLGEESIVEVPTTSRAALTLFAGLLAAAAILKMKHF
ncbi:MAG: PEP-CTERM sorting domain-containing protein [Thermoanaerobaculia bacterium]